MSLVSSFSFASKDTEAVHVVSGCGFILELFNDCHHCEHLVIVIASEIIFPIYEGADSDLKLQDEDILPFFNWVLGKDLVLHLLAVGELGVVEVEQTDVLKQLLRAWLSLFIEEAASWYLKVGCRYLLLHFEESHFSPVREPQVLEVVQRNPKGVFDNSQVNVDFWFIVL